MPVAQELRLRWISALVLAPLALWVAWLGGWLFASFVALAASLMAFEWTRLFDRRVSLTILAPMVLGLWATIFIAQAGYWASAFQLALVGAVLLLVVGIVTQRRAVWLAIGMAYISVPAIATIWLRNGPEDGQTYFIALLLLVWATDTGAYLMGTAFGGRKLIPSLSPSKTWAGLAGGCAIAGVIGMFIAMMTEIAPIVHLTVLGLVGGLTTQMGDIMESGLKRMVNRKDTSGLIPGHGGVMDRLDGFVFTVVVAAVIVWMFKV